MKKVNNYWVDENDNKWLCETTSEEQASMYSDSLIDCKDCKDCRGCSDCKDCNYCNYCNYCSNCKECNDCSHCRGCIYCTHCVNCRGCREYEKTPIQYVTPNIGSRDDNTTFYYDGVDNLQVTCGCFRGNLKKFEKAVRETYKGNEVYLNQYLKEIEKVKVLFELVKGEDKL